MEKLDLPFSIGSGRSLGLDKSNLDLSFEFDPGERKVFAKVVFGDACEGPPEHVHGGISCFVLDEAMGALAWALKYPSVAQDLSFHFAAMVPQKKELRIEAYLDSADEKSANVIAKLSLNDSELVRSSGCFAILPEAKMKKLLASVNYKNFDFKKYYPNS